MLKKQLLSMFTLAAACAAAAPALAAENNFYGVASIGRAKFGADPGAVDNNYNLSHGFATSSTGGQTSVTGGKIQLGYILGKTFALEGGYTYIGRSNFTSTTNLGAIGGSTQGSLFNLDIVGKLPLNEQFSFLARFGGYYWKTESDMPNATTLGTSRVDDNGFDLKVGAGIQYDFNPRFGIRGEFERFNGIGKSGTAGDSKVNQLTVGAVLKF